MPDAAQDAGSLPAISTLDSNTEPPSAGIASRDGNIRFDQYSLEDGLSQSSVFAVLEDSLGFIWVGTEDGLNRFDGYQFKVYRHNPDDPGSLSSSRIRALYEDPAGTLWVGTYGGGLNRFEQKTGKFSAFRHNTDDINSLSNDQILSLAGDPEGWLLVGTRGGGLSRFNPRTEIFMNFQNNLSDPHSLISDTVNSILQDNTGEIWVGTNQGLERFDYRNGLFNHFGIQPDSQKKLSGKNILALYEDRFGVLWIGTSKGLNRISPDRDLVIDYLHNPSDPMSLPHNAINSIIEDKGSGLWIGSERGISLYDREKETFTNFKNDPNDPNSLSSNSVWSLEIDQSGGIWLGTNGGGLNRFDALSERFDHYYSDPVDPNSLSSNNVSAIYQDREGFLWIGTNGAGLNRYNRWQGIWEVYIYEHDDPNSLSNNWVMAILEDGFGNLWIGTEGGGLNLFDRQKEEFTRYQYEPEDPGSLSGNAVRYIYEDLSGNLWISTSNGLNRYIRETDRFQRYTHDPEYSNSLSDNTVGVVYQDHAGRLWIATQGGLDQYESGSGKFSHFRHDPADPNSLSQDIVFSIHEDREGNLWFGTWGGGLNRYEPASDSFSHYRVKDGLPNDVIYGILEDMDGFLWLSTNNGISRFDPRREIFYNYYARDGLQSNEFNLNSYFQSTNDELFFGGVNGFNSFTPSNIHFNSYIPPIRLTSFDLVGNLTNLGGPVETLGNITLKLPENDFEFEYVALSYYQPQDNQYAYMLEGYDQDWNYTGNRRYGGYTNLPGGEYILRIKGSNNDGLWNETGLELTITIKPPFWRTTWFIGLLILTVVGSAYGAYRLRLNNVEARSRELAQLVKMRTQDINRRRQELEALYRADEELHRTLELDQVLQALVDTAVEILGADKGALMAWDEQKETLSLRTAHGFLPETVDSTTFMAGEGVAGWVAISGEPAIVEDTHNDPRVTRTITDPEGIRSFIQVPIKIGDKTFGVFSADYLKPRSFSDDERRLLLSLAQRAAMAIQNAQLYEQAQELAVVQERNRLARDLHDAVTQTLFSTSLISEVLPGVWESDPEEGRRQLEEIRLLSRGALAEMRALLLELRPTEMANARMDDLLRQLVRVTIGRSGIPVEITTDGDCVLPAMAQLTFYRIAQEALNNAGKHSKASKIEIYYTCTDDHTALAIQDDGRGFDVESIPPGHMGVEIMKERAASIGAGLRIISQDGEGTTIRLEWKETNEENIDG